MIQPSSMRDRAAALYRIERDRLNGDTFDSYKYYTSADGRPIPTLITSLKIGAYPV